MTLAKRHHTSSGEVGTLLVVFTILYEPVQCEDAGRDQIVRFEKIQILMIHTKLDVLSSLFLLFHKSGCDASASRHRRQHHSSPA